MAPPQGGLTHPLPMEEQDTQVPPPAGPGSPVTLHDCLPSRSSPHSRVALPPVCAGCPWNLSPVCSRRGTIRLPA